MDSQESEDVRVWVFMCVCWLRKAWVEKNWWSTPLSSLLHHRYGLSLCCLSDAGDGGQAVRWLLEFLRLCGGGLWDGAKAEWQSDTTGANVAGAQRWILPSIAFHYAGCVGCKAFTCPARQRQHDMQFFLLRKLSYINWVCLKKKHIGNPLKYFWYHFKADFECWGEKRW